MSTEPIVVDESWDSPFKVVTNEYSHIEDVKKVGFVFYNDSITTENWEDVRQHATIVYLTPIPDNPGQFILDNHTLSITDVVNNMVLLDENDFLIGSRHFTIIINFGHLKEVKVYITAYVTYKEVTQTVFTIDFSYHFAKEQAGGVGDGGAIHTELFDFASSRSDIIDRYNSITGIQPITQKVTSYDSSSNKLQFIKDVPQFFDGISRKYSYYIWYYLDKANIVSKVRNYIPNFNMDGEIHLGFNERIGSYLYYYYFNQTYIAMIIIGSNGYNKIDINIVPNNLNLEINEPAYRLKINKWFSRLYFVLPKYNEGKLLNRRMYCIYPKDAKDEQGRTIEAKPITTQHSMTVSNVVLPYTINLYTPSTLSIDRILDQYESLYMTEFSDIGDLVEDINSDHSGYYTHRFINIFGSTSDLYTYASQASVWNYKLLNTFDIDNRDTITCLQSFHETSIEQIKYLIEKKYKVYYMGSEYTVGYDEYNDNFLILFKDHPIERVRRKLWDRNENGNIINSFRFFAGEYIIFDDHVESLLGEELSDPTTFFGTNPSDIIAYDRGVVVVSNGNLGAYRK
jgi:hypothetical protein